MQSHYSQPLALYLVFHKPYKIFLPLMFSQQGIQIMFLQDYECFVLYGGNILASVYGDRVRGNRKWMGRERTMRYCPGKREGCRRTWLKIVGKGARGGEFAWGFGQGILNIDKVHVGLRRHVVWIIWFLLNIFWRWMIYWRWRRRIKWNWRGNSGKWFCVVLNMMVGGCMGKAW